NPILKVITKTSRERREVWHQKKLQKRVLPDRKREEGDLASQDKVSTKGQRGASVGDLRQEVEPLDLLKEARVRKAPAKSELQRSSTLSRYGSLFLHLSSRFPCNQF